MWKTSEIVSPLGKKEIRGWSLENKKKKGAHIGLLKHGFLAKRYNGAHYSSWDAFKKKKQKKTYFSIIMIFFSIIVALSR
jgi:hypothetical protein